MTLRSDGQPARTWLYIALVLSLLGTLAHAFMGYASDSGSGHALGSDDAFISFRYAANLMQGHGLVFTPGERVEGYSNLLYVLLVAPAMLAGPDAIYPFSVVLNLLLLGATLALFWWHARTHLGAAAANIGVMVLGLNPWLWANAASGLETTLILAITTATWIALETYRRSGSRGALRALALLALLAVTSRVDGFLLPLLGAAYLAFSRRYRGAAALAGLTMAAMALYTVARLLYYDDVIANTFHNKVSGDTWVRILDGLRFYRIEGIKTWAFPALLIGTLHLALKLVRQGPTTALAALTFPLCFVAAWSGYVVYVGGDIYHERFLLAAIPLALFLVLATTRTWAAPLRAVAIAALAVLPVVYVMDDGRFDYRYPRYDALVEVGRFLGEHYPQATIAVDAAGKVPFFSRLPTVDMLGLNDKYIARVPPSYAGIPGHAKVAPEYVIDRAPDLIAIGAPSLELGWGMTRDHYRLAYDLRYLVNTSRHDLGTRNIVDVRDMNADGVAKLMAGVHQYAILERRSAAEIARAEAGLPRVRPGQRYPHDAEALLFLGWSYPEAEHRWSLGSDGRIAFYLDDPKAFRGTLTLTLGALGEQRVAASLNGLPLGSTTITEPRAWQLSIPADALIAGRNVLDLQWPNARRPDTGDFRILAVSVRDLVLE